MGEPLVIVGKGMAATRLVEELTARALGRYAIVVIGAEPRPAYNRVLLSSLLAGEVGTEGIELRPPGWWRARGVTTVWGRAVEALDLSTRRVRLQDGTALPFARLVLATGSHPIRLPVPGMSLPGVITFRDTADVEAMRRAGPGSRAAVIGGGLLGLEAAYGLAKAGLRVTLVHLMDRLMERQLDRPAAARLRAAIEARGVEVLLEADTARVVGETRAEGLELKDGRVVPADLVVCAIGVRPNADLARAAGLEVGRGVMVDDRLETSVPGIHAIGECAEHRGVAYGLVEPAYEQARVLARRLAGEAAATYSGSVVATNLKVSGVNVFSAGDIAGAEGAETIALRDEGAGLYRKLVIRDGRLAGAVLYGDTADGLWYGGLIRSGADVSGVRDSLVFGRALTERALAS